jgi:hypothetical protein
MPLSVYQFKNIILISLNVVVISFLLARYFLRTSIFQVSTAMPQEYLHLGEDVWNGRIGNVRINWQVNARRKLVRHAEAQKTSPFLLKKASEHWIYQLARRMICQKAVVKYVSPSLSVSSTYLTFSDYRHHILLVDFNATL